MVFAQPRRPIRAQRLDAVEQPAAAIEFDGVTLAIVETEHFDARKAPQRPCEAGRGILSAGEQHQGGPGLQLIGHAAALSTHRSSGQSVERGTSYARFTGPNGLVAP